MTHHSPGKFFADQKQLAETEANRLSKTNLLVSTLRLAAFVIALLGIIAWANSRAEMTLALGAGMLAIIGFGLLVNFQHGIRKKLAFQKNLVQINQDEIDRLKLDLAHLPHSPESQDSKHTYASDLDIFSKKGLFQLINRTSTNAGEELLIKTLKGSYPSDIATYQKAVKELSTSPKSLQDFQAIGMSHPPAQGARQALERFEENKPFRISVFYKAISWIMPPIIIITCILSILGTVPTSAFMIVYVITLGLLSTFQKLVLQQTIDQDRMSGAFGLYREHVRWVLDQKWEEQSLLDFKSRFQGKKDVIKALNSLERIQYYLENRLNIFWTFTIDTFLLADIHLLVSLKKWKDKHSADLTEWRKTLAQMDSMCSIAGFAHSHPSHTYPTISDQPYTYRASELGHPLISADQRVTNHFDISTPQIHLVTGANMSGKSTFLRALGVNAVLAMIGAPVCAREMTISPTYLFTSMRISDDLSENVSSFYAELLRLKMLLDEVNKTERPTMILLDEVLRGTNSKDRHLGVRGILDKLMIMPIYGLVTTHDLALGDLEKSSQGKIENHSFNSSIVEEKLHFDYTYTAGQCHSFSASQLMESLGLIDATKPI